MFCMDKSEGDTSAVCSQAICLSFKIGIAIHDVQVLDYF